VPLAAGLWKKCPTVILILGFILTSRVIESKQVRSRKTAKLNRLYRFAPLPAVLLARRLSGGLADLLTILPKELMNYLMISHLHTPDGFLKPVLAIFFK
jgi:hypothetical protein